MIYPYEGCCGTEVWDRVCRLAEYEADPAYYCPVCGRQLTRVLTAPRSFVKHKFDAFYSPVDGSIITNAHELSEHNKRNNVVNVHDGYDEKAVLDMTKKDFQKPLDDERRKDLMEDAKKAVQKLTEGYKPVVAPEGDTP